MRRIVSIWFPEFAVERFIRMRMKMSLRAPARAGEPFALVEQGAKGLRLVAANEAGRRLGLHRGQRLADARAMAAGLMSEIHEPQKDEESLLGLGRWCERYSPFVSLDPPDGLFIDTTGAAHLFGGEEEMLGDMERRFARFGFTARVAIAATPGAAWGLARYGRASSPVYGRGRGPTRAARGGGEGDVAQGEKARDASSFLPHLPHPEEGRGPLLSRSAAEDANAPRSTLEPLPIEALRIDAATALTLRRLGLKTVGALLNLPRSSLARRFRGEAIPSNVLMRLDEAMGLRDEPLTPLVPPPVFLARQAMMEPLISHEGLEAALQDLIARLCRDLEAAGQGATRLVLRLFKTDGGRVSLPIGLSAPSHERTHLFRLFRPKLDQIDAGFGIDALTLEVREAAAQAAAQYGFMEEDAGDPRAVNQLSDRVMNRHEGRGVNQLATRQSHIPERSEELRHPGESRDPSGRKRDASGIAPAAPWVPAFAGMTEEGTLDDTLRPLLILSPPEPCSVIASVPDGPPMRFTWRRAARRVVKARGPERIAPEWWRLSEPDARIRDYYVVEDDKGRRLWLYREGLYGEEGGEPKWFVHGLFP